MGSRSLMLDNQAAFKICRKNLKSKNPTFYEINSIMSRVSSASTCSMRFPAQINATLDDILTNLKPIPAVKSQDFCSCCFIVKIVVFGYG